MPINLKTAASNIGILLKNEWLKHHPRYQGKLPLDDNLIHVFLQEN